MPGRLTNYEQETIINFNKAEDVAYIFTYEKTWQKHLEGKLGLKPLRDNGHGGREYEIDKKRIKPPRAPRKLSDSTKKKLADRLHGNRVLSAENLVAVGKSATRKQNKDKSPAPQEELVKVYN